MAQEELKHEHHEKDLPLVLLLGPPPSSFPNFISKQFGKFKFLSPYDFPTTPIHQFLIDHAQSVRVLVSLRGGGAISVEILNCLPSLEYIVCTSAGVNHVDLAECKRRGIIISNAGTVFSDRYVRSCFQLSIACAVALEYSTKLQFVLESLSFAPSFITL